MKTENSFLSIHLLRYICVYEDGRERRLGQIYIYISLYIYILFQSAKYDHQIHESRDESRDLKNLMRLFVLIRPTRTYLHHTKSAQ